MNTDETDETDLYGWGSRRFHRLAQMNLRSFAPFCVICVHSKSVIIRSVLSVC